MSRQRNQRYPLNQPPDGMVVEPALPTRDPMTPSQTSVNNSLTTADDETLPPVRDAQGNPVPLTEFGGMTDDAPEDVPVEVRRATASVPAKGVHFNFQPFQQIAQLHAAGQTQEAIAMRDSLDPQSRYVYDNIKNMKKVPASEAARLADEFRQNQDRIAMQEQTPQARALKTVEAEKAQKTVEMSNDILSIMDRLRGFKKGEKGSEKKTPKYFGRVGTFDSLLPAATSGDRAGWYIDHKTLEDTLALAEAQANRGQGNFTETERLMLRSAATGGLNYGRDDASYAQIFEGMYDMFKNKAEEQKAIASPAQSAPAAAAQPATPAQPAPAAAAPGFQPGKIYRDGQGRPARFRGYDAQGNPTFDKI